MTILVYIAWDKSYVGKFTVEEAESTRCGKVSFKSAYLLTKISVTKEEGRNLSDGVFYI